MNVFEVRDEEEWEKILDDLHEELGIPAILVDPGSMMVMMSGEKHPFCAKIRSNNEAFETICAQSQKFLADEAKKTKQPVIITCEAGMTKCVVPVFAKDEYAGSIVLCGNSIPGTEIKTSFVAVSLDVSEDEITPLLQHIPEMGQKEFDAIARRVFKQIHGNS